jgi:hypothetical protein
MNTTSGGGKEFMKMSDAVSGAGKSWKKGLTIKW